MTATILDALMQSAAAISISLLCLYSFAGGWANGRIPL